MIYLTLENLQVSAGLLQPLIRNIAGKLCWTKQMLMGVEDHLRAREIYLKRMAVLKKLFHSQKNWFKTGETNKSDNQQTTTIS